jgi:hypothetical protein
MDFLHNATRISEKKELKPELRNQLQTPILS